MPAVKPLIDEALTWAVEEIIDRNRLAKLLKSKKKLVVKLGVDPTSPDLHLGHAVVLEKLRQFQQLGHQTTLVIGDFTALIGDPTGVNKTRPQLTKEQINQNLQTYLKQASLIIDLKKTKVVKNSQWLSQYSLERLIEEAAKISVNTLIEREDFASRLKSKQRVSLHEFIYPLVQAVDSVELKADIELGGWDQRLNLLLGRELQKKSGLDPQDIILISPLIGTDGKKKMSSSLNNYIGIAESADQMFGKVMSIPDQLIEHYGHLAALVDDPKDLAYQKKAHPKSRKERIAFKIVERFHSASAASTAQKNFQSTFSDKNIAEQLTASISFSNKSVTLLEAVAVALECSKSHSHRLIEQGAVKVNNNKSVDPKLELNLLDEPLLQVGRHLFRRLTQRR